MKNEKGITLIKLILIVAVIVAVAFGIYAILPVGGNNDTVIKPDVTENEITNEITNEAVEISNTSLDNTLVDDGSMDVEVTTFADASKYKIGDIITAGTITVGFVEIPDIKINYPIASKVTTDPALAYSPAYLYGPGLNQVGRTTIVGMVKSFGDIEKVKVDSIIKIIDDDEIEKEYKVIEVKKVSATDSSFAKTKNETIAEIAISLVDKTNKQERLVIIAEEKID